MEKFIRIHEPLKSFPSRVLHAVLLTGGWACYAYMIYYVYGEGGHDLFVRDALRHLIFLIIFSTTLVPLATLMWVKHLFKIRSSTEPRVIQGEPQQTDLPYIPPHIAMDPEALKKSRLLSIKVYLDQKVFVGKDSDYLHANLPTTEKTHAETIPNLMKQE